MVTCLIPFKTPSVNRLYFPLVTKSKKSDKIVSRRVLTREGKQLQEVIRNLVKGNLPVGVELVAYIEVHDNFYNKDGSIKKIDIDNKVKFILDAIFNCTEADDCQLWEVHVKKVHNPTIHATAVEIKRKES